MQVIILVCWRC